MARIIAAASMAALLGLGGRAEAYTRVRSEHEWALKELKDQLKDRPSDARILREIGERLVLWMSNDDEDRAEVPLARFYLEKARAGAPSDPLPVAWLGILRMIEAKTAPLFDRKDLAKEGLAILDEAVTLDPDHPKVRLLRGSVSVKVPDSFDRYGQALEDLTLVAGQVEARPRLAAEQNISLCVLYLNLGKAYRHHDEGDKAAAAWEKAILHEPDRDENAEASRLLSRHRESSSGWARYSGWRR